MVIPPDLFTYPELIIKRNIIPYDDAQIEGQYTRYLKLPADLIPELSVLSAQGKNKPRLLTCQHVEQALDVYVVNLGGTGGAPGNAAGYYGSTLYRATNQIPPNNFKIAAEPGQMGRYFYGFTWNVNGASSLTPGSRFEVQIMHEGTPPTIILDSITLDSASTDLFISKTYLFPTPWDLSETFDDYTQVGTYVSSPIASGWTSGAMFGSKPFGT